MAEDFYKILGVSPQATDDEIQKAYRGLARKYHPDLNDDSEQAKTQFQKVQQAYDVLSDDDKRRMYDQVGPDFDRYQNAAGGAGQMPFEFDLNQMFGSGNRGGGSGGFGGLDDILRQFQGGGFPGGPSAPGRRRPEKGQDVTVEIKIPFQTSIQGGNAHVNLKGSGKAETVEIKIPAGIEPGKKLRLKGQGGQSPGGGPPGDALVLINVAPHPFYVRKRNNLEVQVPVTVAEAVSGGKINVPTPDGTTSVSLPPMSSSGSKLRLKGLGVKTAKSTGDLLVVIQIVLPEAANGELEALARAVSEDHDPRQELCW
jgi:curved DNA-binding protein